MHFWVIVIFVIMLIACFLFSYRAKLNKRQFSPLEQSLVNAFIDSLNSRSAELINAQLVARPIRRRIFYPKSEALYLYPTDIKIVTPGDICFPCKQEQRLAIIYFGIKGTSDKWKAEFNTVSGHLFEIIIRPNPKKYQSSRAEIARIKLEDDPFDVVDLSVERIRFNQDQKLIFTGYLAEWNDRYQLEPGYQPITPDKLEKILNKFKAKFPEGYWEIFKQTEGLRVNDCRILGISEVYSVSLDDGNYLYLAEKEGQGMLGIREKSRTGELYYFPFDGGVGQSYGKNFKEAVEKMIGEA